MEDINGKDEFIKMVAERARFTQKDVRIIVDVIIDIFRDAIKSRARIFIGGLGTLYIQKLPARKSSKLFGEKDLPASERVIFRISEVLRESIKDAT